jgi:hypothetical protein
MNQATNRSNFKEWNQTYSSSHAIQQYDALPPLIAYIVDDEVNRKLFQFVCGTRNEQVLQVACCCIKPPGEAIAILYTDAR